MSDLPAEARADIAQCRALLRDGSKTFYLASLVLPRAVREPASALYAFCRVADDAIDRGGDAGGTALAELHDRLRRAYEGRPVDAPIDRALSHVVRHFAVPRDLPESLLEGFAWDAEGRRYETIEDVYAYAARVAGSVGAMMAVLMGARDAARLARACDLGVAMQLSNIARDVGEDARAGRLYLPLAWLRAARIEPEAWLRAPVFTPALGGVVARLLHQAEALYTRAGSGVRALPFRARPGIAAARRLYAEIGREVARQHFDSVSRRAVVRTPRKLAGLGVAVAGALLPGQPDPAPALEQTRYLVDSVVRHAPGRPMPVRPLPGRPLPVRPLPARPLPIWPMRGANWIDDRAAWIVDLFTRLDERHADAMRGRLRGSVLTEPS